MTPEELQECREWAETFSSPVDRFHALDLILEVERLQVLVRGAGPCFCCQEQCILDGCLCDAYRKEKS